MIEPLQVLSVALPLTILCLGASIEVNRMNKKEEAERRRELEAIRLNVGVSHDDIKSPTMAGRYVNFK